MSSNSEVGIIGLGLVGTALTERLLEHGCRVVIWNRSREKADALAARGAVWSHNPLAEDGRVIISLCTTDVVEQVLGQLDAGLHSDQIILDTMTGEPEQTATLCAKLAARGVQPVPPLTARRVDGLLDADRPLPIHTLGKTE